ncbi:MAG: hypothetical protein JWN50_265 [Parcubacteria group bacterium]|nr:hypothetical protein [Parcubacteria group bacterium]
MSRGDAPFLLENPRLMLFSYGYGPGNHFTLDFVPHDKADDSENSGEHKQKRFKDESVGRAYLSFSGSEPFLTFRDITHKEVEEIARVWGLVTYTRGLNYVIPCSSA